MHSSPYKLINYRCLFISVFFQSLKIFRKTKIKKTQQQRLMAHYSSPSEIVSMDLFECLDRKYRNLKNESIQNELIAKWKKNGEKKDK